LLHLGPVPAAPFDGPARDGQARLVEDLLRTPELIRVGFPAVIETGAQVLRHLCGEKPPHSLLEPAFLLRQGQLHIRPFSDPSAPARRRRRPLYAARPCWWPHRGALPPSGWVHGRARACLPHDLRCSSRSRAGLPRSGVPSAAEGRASTAMIDATEETT